MSSEIFYDKAFIRAGEKYIPVVNHGSSNCFEFDSRGREIPEKTWSVLNHPYTERMLFTADEIREIADFYEEISMSNRGGTKKSRNRSFVITPSSMVRIAAASSLSANAASAALPSSSPRLRSAPVQAKMVAIGFVEVSSPRRWR